MSEQEFLVALTGHDSDPVWRVEALRSATHPPATGRRAHNTQPGFPVLTSFRHHGNLPA
jgi:hypothetical protein